MAEDRDNDLIEDLKQRNAELEEARRTLLRFQADIARLRDETERALMISVTLLAKAAELHDEGTGNHILRIDRYAGTLARQLGLPAAFRKEIDFSAALHDVGKTSVNTALLRKRGSLTPAERVEVGRHTEYGYHILRQSERLQMAADIAWSHHERWDGSGYPRRLAGEAIPLPARIVTVADVYDALRSPRPYKAGRDHADVCAWMMRQKGHFDPEVLSAFKRCHADLGEIYESLADQPSPGF